MIIGAMMLLVSTPAVMAYSMGLPVFDLWTFFVVEVFGGFWISVFALMIVIALILFFGGVSWFTVMIYEILFLMSMAIGYGYVIITIPLFTAVVFWTVVQIMRYINSSNY